MAEIIRYVNTASVGGDGTTNNTSGATAAYATLAAALEGEEADLVTATDNLIIYVDGGADTGNIADTSTDGYICNSTYDIKILPNTGNEAGTEWNASIYHLTRSDFAYSFRTSNNNIYITIDNIQISQTSSGVFGCVYGAGTGTRIIKNCHLRRVLTSTNSGFVANSTGAGTEIWVNNILHQTGGTPSVMWGLGVNGGGVAYNNTVISDSCTSDMITDPSFNYNAGYFKNNICQNSGSGGCIGGSWSFTGSATNITDDATSPDGASYRNLTATFTSSSDFSLQSGDSNAKDNGTDLSGDGQYSFSTDMLGTTRSGTWDIGAYEVVAASTPGIEVFRTIPGVTH